ncbi:putative ABC transporter permease subunit [Kosmotoga pacifica]|uniref:Uncharacterized protein n=1 Tax=Kosmotoga pacifica TaxID=1330330 RepID=A0A0G2ZFJ9_9BACT|nr:hypothetical protein [Kosmotoga pacifica]AKI97543.1 hypothetical protein IX53_06630 [Kosmotoga pacifica]
MELKRLISLIWTIANANYGFSNIKYTYSKDKKRLWILVLMAYVIGVLIFSFVYFYKPLLVNSYRQLAAIGMERLFLANAFVSSGVIGFMTGFFLLINTLFFSKDMKVLTTLPLKASEVVTAKLFTVIIFQMLVSIVILLPSLIYFGLKNNMGVSYWIYTAVLFLLSQIFPMLFQTVLVLPLSRVVRFSKLKDFMLYFLGGAALAGSLVALFFIYRSSFSGGKEGLDFANFLADPNALINKLTYIYPPAFFATKTLLGSGIVGSLWLLGNIGLHGLVFAFTIWFAKKYYYDTYSELQEFYAMRKDVTSEELIEKLSKERSCLSILHSREWKYFLRVPSFALNGLAGTLIMPVMALMFIYIYRGNPQVGEQIDSFLFAVKDFYVPIGILAGVLVSSMNGLAASTFSREGKLLSELKVLPLSATDIFKAKFLNIMEVGAMGILFMTVVLHIMFGGTVLQDVLIVLLSLIVSAFLNLIQFMIDAIRPLLNWDNPQRAIKQNWNVALSIFIVFGFVGGFGFLITRTIDVISPALLTILITFSSIAGFLALLKPALKKIEQLIFRDV